MAKIGRVYHPQYLKHDTGWGHPERPDRLRAIVKMLAESGLEKKMIEVNPRKATVDEIALVHDPDYIDSVARTSGQEASKLDPDTVVSPESFDSSLLAAGGLLEAVDRVLGGDMDHVFALVRPPGHHAERDHAMGFCIFNNIGVAAEYLVKHHGLKRVAIVDFDVHHGNATQHMFYDRPEIFFISTHRYPFYPGTGAAHEKGQGAGAGFTLNIPMEAGWGDAEYRQAFTKKVIPALREYKPQFILVSAGFDAHRRDPLGGMNVSEEGYEFMTKEIEKVAQDFCQGKAVYTLEGGYDLQGLSKSVQKVLEVLLKQ